MTHHQTVAHILTTTADELTRHPRLNPYTAVKRALVDIPNSAAAHNEAISAIETASGRRGQGLDQIPRHDLINAARSEAARYQSYGGH